MKKLLTLALALTLLLAFAVPALAGTESLQVSYPSFAGREDGEAIMRLDEVTRCGIVIIACERFGDGR